MKPAAPVTTTAIGSGDRHGSAHALLEVVFFHAGLVLEEVAEQHIAARDRMKVPVQACLAGNASILAAAGCW
jgi:hypothetical protein